MTHACSVLLHTGCGCIPGALHPMKRPRCNSGRSGGASLLIVAALLAAACGAASGQEPAPGSLTLFVMGSSRTRPGALDCRTLPETLWSVLDQPGDRGHSSCIAASLDGVEAATLEVGGTACGGHPCVLWRARGMPHSNCIPYCFHPEVGPGSPCV